MNIENVKNRIKKELYLRHSFIYKGNRNFIEEFDGIIIKCYSRVFVIELDDGRNKSFSYSDFIIGNLQFVS